MTLSLRYPPTLSSLLEDETYYTYFCRKPKLAPGIRHGNPWMLMIHTRELKWKRALCATYSEAVDKAEWVLDHPKVYRDVSIVSKRRVFKQPSWIYSLYGDAFSRWCGRCRRPTLYLEYGHSHPALKDAPVIVEYQKRCYFCGAREELACRVR